MPSISKEDYLKTIYSLSGEHDSSVSTTEIADTLRVSKAAVSEMTRKLAKLGYLKLQRYKGVRLTRKGTGIALQIIRRHRLWELFLLEVLGIPWSRVHDEAETLEHHSSDFLIDEIDRHLGYPEFDPHGAPIPDKNGSMPEQTGLIALADGTAGNSYCVEQVTDRDSELIEYFTALGIELKKKISVLDILAFDKSVLIQINGSKHSISRQVASNIFVTICS